MLNLLIFSDDSQKESVPEVLQVESEKFANDLSDQIKNSENEITESCETKEDNTEAPEIQDEKIEETKNQLLQQLEEMEVDLTPSNQNTQEMDSEHLDSAEPCEDQPEAYEDHEKQEDQIKEFVEDESMKLKEKTYFQNQQLFELGRFSILNSQEFQNYFKGCLFSPDGCCILAPVNGDGIHVFELPQDLYGQEEVSETREITKMKSVIYVRTACNIYDFCWYPYMNSQAPETCFWISTSQNEAIKLYDAFNGNLTASYRGYDAVDELESAYSLCFSSDGQQIIGGYKKSIKVFTTSVPGREYDTIPLKQSISCLATNYYQENVLAAGSWNKTISLIDLRIYEPFEYLNTHKGGLTYLKFSLDGKYLISGSRKDSYLLVWDMNHLKYPIHNLQRRVDTNQTIYFDKSIYNWIVSGDTRGLVHVWDLSDISNDSPKELQFPVSSDCCNGISLSPYLPIFATSSGQYHFEESENQSEIDNSLSLWWFGKNKEPEE